MDTNHNHQDDGNSSATKLIFILSPAKTMNVTPMTRNQPIPWTKPSCDVSKTQELITIMKQYSPSSLQKLLHISETLAMTAKQYWDQMTLGTSRSSDDNKDDDDSSSTSNHTTGKPCIFTFQGAAYQGLDIDTLLTTKSKHDDLAPLRYLQERLRIVDPLYGWLRPMDEILPYRLEMATKNIPLVDRRGTTNDDDDDAGDKTKSKPRKKTKHDNKKNDKKSIKLHEYWKPSIQASIRNEGGTENVAKNNKEGEDEGTKSIVIINLASEEYSIAVDYTPRIDIVFRHEGRVIGIHAKRARGLMVRYCAKNQIQNLSQLEQFAEEGYRYQPQQSNATTMVFDRSKNWNTGK